MTHFAFRGVRRRKNTSPLSLNAFGGWRRQVSVDWLWSTLHPHPPPGTLLDLAPPPPALAAPPRRTGLAPPSLIQRSSLTADERPRGHLLQPRSTAVPEFHRSAITGELGRRHDFSPLMNVGCPNPQSSFTACLRTALRRPEARRTRSTLLRELHPISAAGPRRQPPCTISLHEPSLW